MYKLFCNDAEINNNCCLMIVIEPATGYIGLACVSRREFICLTTGLMESLSLMKISSLEPCCLTNSLFWTGRLATGEARLLVIRRDTLFVRRQAAFYWQKYYRLINSYSSAKSNFKRLCKTRAFRPRQFVFNQFITQVARK